MKYEIGQKVTWTSQAGGSEKQKTGKVVFIIPENFGIGLVRGRFNKGYYYSERKYKEAFDGSGLPREHESYIVAVPSKSGRGKETLYSPRVKNLKLVE